MWALIAVVAIIVLWLILSLACGWTFEKCTPKK
jgi:hypothetical protein